MKHSEVRRFAQIHPSSIGDHPLDSRLTERRAERFRQVLARRVTKITVVIDDCFDPHNATAVLRSCEAFGLNEIHVVTPRNRFRVNKKISQGAQLYTTVHSHRSISAVYDELKSHDFRIIASSLSADATVDPHELSSEESPIALVFGNEESGVSDEGLDGADGRFYIPMSGFTQSLNLSVTVAVALYSIRHLALARDEIGDMSADEQRSTYDRWIRRQTERNQNAR